MAIYLYLNCVVHVSGHVFVCVYVYRASSMLFCSHREHAMLVKIAGVKHLVVLINKMDDPTVKWSEERWALFGIP